MYDKYSGRSRRFAFVTMKTVEDANAVIEKLNGTVSIIAEYAGTFIKIVNVHSAVYTLYHFKDL